MLQISCYTTGNAFQSAQMDISQAAMEDAEVRDIYAGTLSLSRHCPHVVFFSTNVYLWGRNFQSAELRVGIGNLIFSFSLVHF